MQSDVDDDENKPEFSMKNFNKVCRTCFNHDDLQSLKRANLWGEIRAIEFLRSCFHLTFQKDDALPENICLSCLSLLRTFYKFWEQCHKYDIFYRAVMAKELKGMHNISESTCNAIFNGDCVLKVVENNYEKLHAEDFNCDLLKEIHNSDIRNLNPKNCGTSAQDLSDDYQTISSSSSPSSILVNERSKSNSKNIRVKHLACLKCGIIFSQSYYFTVHMRIHSQNQLYTCRKCGEPFKSKCSLLIHMRVHAKQLDKRSSQEFSVCSPRAKIYEKQSNLQPVALTATSYRCHHCEAAFSSKEMLCSHIKSHYSVTHSEPIAPVSPSSIHGTYSNNFNTIQMLQQIAIQNGRITSITNAPKDLPRTKTSKSRRSVKKIINGSHKKISKTKHIMRSSVGDTQNIPDHSSEIFICMQCNKQFDSRSSLNAHMHVHSVENPYKCAECSCEFTNRSSFTKHMIVQHTPEKELYNCSKCSARFASRSSLNIHMRLHSGDKPFACDICSATFAIKPYLMRHKKTHNVNIKMRLHSEEKPFVCDICSAKFALKPYLVRHKKTHNLNFQMRLNPGEKPFACDICSATFAIKPYLTRHKKTHTKKAS